MFGRSQFEDRSATNQGRRFYRALVLPRRPGLGGFWQSQLLSSSADESSSGYRHSERATPER